MSSRWLFDLGNTRLKCAPLHDDGRIGEMLALAYRDDGIASFDPSTLRQAQDSALRLSALSGVPLEGDVAYVASVAAPESTIALLGALTQRFTRISIVRTQTTFADVRIAYDEPAALGVDRFLALLGARARCLQPTLVVGIGTALTIDLLDADGRHHGGRIAPSPALMRESLHQRAAQLPASGGAYVEFAADTIAALASGCEGAALALIERSVTEAAHSIGMTPTVLLHGGGAQALQLHLPHADSVPALVLEGLAQWAAVEANTFAKP